MKARYRITFFEPKAGTQTRVFATQKEALEAFAAFSILYGDWPVLLDKETIDENLQVVTTLIARRDPPETICECIHSMVEEALDGIEILDNKVNNWLRYTPALDEGDRYMLRCAVDAYRSSIEQIQECRDNNLIPMTDEAKASVNEAEESAKAAWNATKEECGSQVLYRIHHFCGNAVIALLDIDCQEGREE